MSVLFLIVAGTMIYEVYILSTIERTDAVFGPTVAALVLTSTALLGLVALFVSYTVTTYDKGNWLQSIVNRTKAKYNRALVKKADIQSRISQQKQKLKDLAKISMNPTATLKEKEEIRKEKESLQKIIDHSQKQLSTAEQEFQVATEQLEKEIQLPPPLTKEQVEEMTRSSESSGSFSLPPPINQNV